MAESVVVIKKLLQINVSDQYESLRAFALPFAAIAVQRDHQADRAYGGQGHRTRCTCLDPLADRRIFRSYQSIGARCAEKNGQDVSR